MTDEITQNDCQGEGPEFVERAEIARLQAELNEAREIMKPFANLADYCDQPRHSSSENLFIVPVNHVAKDSIIKVEHCRRARAFLKGETDA